MNTNLRSNLTRAAGAACIILAVAVGIGSADSPLLTRGGHDRPDLGALPVHAIATLHKDPVALTAMCRYAALHLGDFDVLPDTFGGTPHWSPNWHLHWVDVRHGEHLVRIYHATGKHQAHLHYTMMYDDESTRSTDWERDE